MRHRGVWPVSDRLPVRSSGFLGSTWTFVGLQARDGQTINRVLVTDADRQHAECLGVDVAVDQPEPTGGAGRGGWMLSR